MSDLNALFQEAQDAGLDKDATIMKLAQGGGLGITAAIREYQKLAKSAGLILSVKERTEKVDEFLGDYSQADLVDTESRKNIISVIADEFDISSASAAQHVRGYCDRNEIILPTVQRTSLEDMVTFVKEQLDGGKDRKEVVEALQDEMGYTANSAASAYSRATRELGISTGNTGAKADISEVVSFIREHLDMPRKEAVAKMVEDLGYAESTANTFFTYLPMAREYARQEVEALGG